MNSKKLLALFVLPTVACNMNCNYCFTRFHKDFKSNIGTNINIKKYEEFLSKLSQDFDVVSFITGGEPFLFNEIETLIKITASKSFSVHIITNWTKFDPNILKQLNRLKNIRLYLSCHERWNKMKSLTQSIKDKVNFPIVISQIINTYNYQEANDLSLYCEKNNIQFLPQLLGSIYNTEMEKLSFLSFSDSDKKLISPIFEKHGRSSFFSRWENWNTNKNLITGCPNDNRTLILYPNGDLLPCFFRSDLKLGNIYNYEYSLVLKNITNLKIDTERPNCAKIECNCLLKIPETKNVYLKTMDSHEG